MYSEERFQERREERSATDEARKEPLLKPLLDKAFRGDLQPDANNMRFKGRVSVGTKGIYPLHLLYVDCSIIGSMRQSPISKRVRPTKVASLFPTREAVRRRRLLRGSNQSILARFLSGRTNLGRTRQITCHLWEKTHRAGNQLVDASP